MSNRKWFIVVSVYLVLWGLCYRYGEAIHDQYVKGHETMVGLTLYALMMLFALVFNIVALKNLETKAHKSAVIPSDHPKPLYTGEQENVLASFVVANRIYQVIDLRDEDRIELRTSRNFMEWERQVTYARNDLGYQQALAFLAELVDSEGKREALFKMVPIGRRVA